MDKLSVSFFGYGRKSVIKLLNDFLQQSTDRENALKKQIFDLKCKADELTKSLETEQINLEEKSFENERLQDEVIALNFSLDDKNQQIDCLNHLIDDLKRKVDSLTGSQSTGRKNQKIINFGSYVNKRKIKRIIGVRKKRRQNSK